MNKIVCHVTIIKENKVVKINLVFYLIDIIWNIMKLSLFLSINTQVQYF
ncbi:hypothetical protein A1OE_262 [Candidatus Endolissoclinum faulkneri L2]|uniref:Uncharacterized protein n=1 Tax=Candidatus Endolissoclinum faulkneri L2 TaxID=1193729 RepID=K7YLW4_9PROT|nr:hypothetical protein A1OE_262 [Candidatus Endolissoclinum faulkneri L2]